MTKAEIFEKIVIDTVKQGRKHSDSQKIFGRDSQESRLELAKWEALYDVLLDLHLQRQYMDKLRELSDVSLTEEL